MLNLVTVIAAILATSQSPSTQQSSPQPAPVAQAEEEAEDAADEEVVCRRERVLGSNRPQRICMTRGEWADQSDASRESVRQMDRGMPDPLPDSGL